MRLSRGARIVSTCVFLSSAMTSFVPHLTITV